MTTAHRTGVTLLAVLALLLSALALALPTQATHGPAHTYSVLASTGVLVPGTTEIGLAGEDDTTTTMPLPFDVTFYGTVYAAASDLVVSTNGNVQFTGDDSDYTDSGDCLPEDDFEATIFAFFSDLLFDVNAGDGVYTAVTGVAPTRQLIIEWRGVDYDTEEAINVELILYEASPVITVIYGTMGNTGEEAIIGVQELPAGPHTEYLCTDFDAVVGGDQAVAAGTRLDFVPAGITGSVTVNKTGTGGAALAGAGFTLRAADCTTQVAAEQVTDASGVTVLTNIDASASYCLVETTVPAGYQAAANATVTLTLDPGTGTFGDTVAVVNTAVGTATPTPAQLPNTAAAGETGTGDPGAAVVVLVLALFLSGGAIVVQRMRMHRLG